MLITLLNMASLLKETLWLMRRLHKLVSVSCEQLTFFRLEIPFSTYLKCSTMGSDLLK